MAKPNIVLVGEPNPKQVEFFKATARHICYGGARGGGKSWAMRRKFVLLAMNYSGLKLLLMRRTFPELDANHIRELQRELAAAINAGWIKYTDSKREFKFWNGSMIKMGYCDAEKDVYQYQGQEYDVIGLEEATQFTETQMQFITTCNRSTRTDFKPRMYYTCNPGGVGHAWVKRLFIDREYINKERPENYVFIAAGVRDNNVLMETNPEYIDMLSNLDEDRRRAFLEGDWDALSGQFFREWRRDKHVCEPFDIPEHWRRFRAMDWGYNDPCCVLWFAVGPDGHIYVYDEHYKPNLLATEVAGIIKEKTGLTRISYTAASPDMWSKRGVVVKASNGLTGETIAEVFMKSGVPLVAADNSRIIGWQRVREYLREAPDGVPYLQVFSNCENLIKYMPLMQFDENNHEDAMDGNDHACLTGDTLIHTASGFIPIRELVGETGEVWAYDEGKREPKKAAFRDVRLTRKQAEVYEVTTEDGTTFKGTGDHRVLVSTGEWKSIRELTDADCIVRI